MIFFSHFRYMARCFIGIFSSEYTVQSYPVYLCITSVLKLLSQALSDHRNHQRYCVFSKAVTSNFQKKSTVILFYIQALSLVISLILIIRTVSVLSQIFNYSNFFGKLFGAVPRAFSCYTFPVLSPRL